MVAGGLGQAQEAGPGIFELGEVRISEGLVASMGDGKFGRAGLKIVGNGEVKLADPLRCASVGGPGAGGAEALP
jgi:hypothetical protein